MLVDIFRSSAARLRRRWWLAGLVVLAISLGCNKIKGLFGEGGKEAAAKAEKKLQAGDLPGAADAYEAAVKAHPQSVDCATGAAYMALLKGDLKAADAYLVAAEKDAGDRAPEIHMRRALVALRAGDLDQAAAEGKASGLAAGKLIAAEVSLADGERDLAKALLQDVKKSGGALGEIASQYLQLLASKDPVVAGMSEEQALWALGKHKVAVRSVEELVKALPDTVEDRNEQLLLWAGRAATIGETDVARSIMSAMIFPPKGQAWRKVATEAIIACADGDGDSCAKMLDSLEGSAPADGLADARATAAALIARHDPAAAKKVAGSFASNSTARALLEAGDRDAALDAAPQGGMLAKYLDAGG